MRQRKIKNVEEKILKYDYMLIDNPMDKKGEWSSVFGNENPIYLEIGCGKGQFICRNRDKYPERNFVAIEAQISVCYKALRKAAGDPENPQDPAQNIGNEETECGGDKEPGNIRFVREYVNDITDMFADEELNGLYLNFSDPWPKKRHEKRRLTYRDNLRKYAKIIKPGGFIQFKTDNDGLFEFTLEEIENEGFKIEKCTRNLEQSEFSADNIKTEYEEKFMDRGKDINYVLVRL